MATSDPGQTKVSLGHKSSVGRVRPSCCVRGSRETWRTGRRYIHYAPTFFTRWGGGGGQEVGEVDVKVEVEEDGGVKERQEEKEEEEEELDEEK